MSSEVRAAAELMIDAGILAWDRVVRLQSLEANLDFNEVALDEGSSYEQVYLKGLSLRHFNFLLNDQSFIQLAPRQEGARFAYYPNPFTDPDGLLELIDDPLDFDAFAITELGATAGRAPLRYDYSEDQYREILHPCAHFHLGHGELGRLAANRKFCPLTFCLLILRLYYPVEWSAFMLNETPPSGFVNTLDEKLFRGLVANGLVNATFFSRIESSFLHIGAP